MGNPGVSRWRTKTGGNLRAWQSKALLAQFVAQYADVHEMDPETDFKRTGPDPDGDFLDGRIEAAWAWWAWGYEAGQAAP